MEFKNELEEQLVILNDVFSKMREGIDEEITKVDAKLQEVKENEVEDAQGE